MSFEVKWELWLETLTLAGALIAAIWAIYVYSDTKQKEFYAAFWNKKMELYIGVSEAASILATTESVEEFQKARSIYWAYFYGRLSVVEDESVKRAMQTFAGTFPAEGVPQGLPLGNGDDAYRLAVALKSDLVQSWKRPFRELDQGK